MKKELKISTLSIVCVLCTAIAMPSFGASAVRSIGGAGTYSSASNAATAGSKTSSGSTNSVRAGALRSTGAKATTSASSTRAAATPRLSIGKYLGGATTAKPSTGSSSSGSINPGQAGVEQRVTKLEKALGLDEYNGDFGSLVIDVEQMQKDIAALTGEMPLIEFEDGVLTIVQDGKPEKIDLNDYFASADALQALEDKINEIVIPDLTDYAKKADLDGLLTSADLSDLETAVAVLESAVEDLDAAAVGEVAGRVEKLEQAGEGLSSAIAALQAIDHDAYATDDELTALSDELKDLIEQAKSDDTTGDLEAELGDLSSDLTNLMAQVLANQNAIAQNVADIAQNKTDIAKNKTDIAGLTGALTEYVQRTELAAVATSGSYNDLLDKPTIPSIDGLATKDALAQMQATLEAAIEAKHAAGDYATADALAVVIKDVEALKGSSASDEVIQRLNERVNAIAADYATDSEVQTAVEAVKALIPSLADYIKSSDLAAVATSGSYNDLTDKPDLTQYVTEAKVEQSVSTAINAYEIPDGSVTADKIQNGAVTSEKINTEAAAGEMVMLMSNGDGTSSWVSVTVDAE